VTTVTVVTQTAEATEKTKKAPHRHGLKEKGKRKQAETNQETTTKVTHHLRK
jgi:hypothetical protein